MLRRRHFATSPRRWVWHPNAAHRSWWRRCPRGAGASLCVGVALATQRNGSSNVRSIALARCREPMCENSQPRPSSRDRGFLFPRASNTDTRARPVWLAKGGNPAFNKGSAGFPIGVKRSGSSRVSCVVSGVAARVSTKPPAKSLVPGPFEASVHRCPASTGAAPRPCYHFLAWNHGGRHHIATSREAPVLSCRGFFFPGPAVIFAFGRCAFEIVVQRI